MNFFEGELRKLLGDSDVISDPASRAGPVWERWGRTCGSG